MTSLNFIIVLGYLVSFFNGVRTYALAPVTTTVSSARAVATLGSTRRVSVGAEGKLVFSPDRLDGEVGEVIEFVFYALNHTLTQSSLSHPCTPLPGFDTGFNQFNPTNSSGLFIVNYQITTTDPQWFFCAQTQPKSHCKAGMVFALNPRNNTQNFLSIATQDEGATTITKTTCILDVLSSTTMTETVTLLQTLSAVETPLPEDISFSPMSTPFPSFSTGTPPPTSSHVSQTILSTSPQEVLLTETPTTTPTLLLSSNNVVATGNLFNLTSVILQTGSSSTIPSIFVPIWSNSSASPTISQNSSLVSNTTLATNTPPRVSVVTPSEGTQSEGSAFLAGIIVLGTTMLWY